MNRQILNPLGMTSSKRKIAYWQSGAWCDDATLPELAANGLDYDVLTVDFDMPDAAITERVNSMLNIGRVLNETAC